MESLELIDREFLNEKKSFEKLGYELVGTKFDSNDKLYLVRKKR